MFKEIFTRLCIKNGESPSAVCIKLGLSNAVYSKWDENSVPRKATLIKIADYFGVTVEYLKGEEKEKVPSGTSDKTLEFMKLYSQLSEEQQKLVLSQIKGILADE